MPEVMRSRYMSSRPSDLMFEVDGTRVLRLSRLFETELVSVRAEIV